MTCPNCDGNITYKGKMKVCAFCGYQEMDETAVKNYNVLVVCPPGTKTPIRIEIADSGIVFDSYPGESRGIKLAPGPHKITFVAGGTRNERVIYAFDNNEIVKIAVSYDPISAGSIYLQIEQPDTQGKFPKLEDGKLPPSERKSSIVALILSVTFIASIAGIILAVINIKRSKRENRHADACDIAAIVFGGYITFVMTFFIILDII